MNMVLLIRLLEDHDMYKANTEVYAFDSDDDNYYVETPNGVILIPINKCEIVEE